MRNVTHAAVQTQLFSLLNLAEADVTAADEVKMNAFIARRAREAYLAQWWPETLLSEERTVTQSGDRCYIELAQSSEIPIGQVRGVYLDDPLVDPEPRRVRFVLSEEKIYLPANLYTTLFVWFQLRPPVLSGVAFNAASIYSSGTTVYYSSANPGYEGDYWTANATTTAGQDPEDTPAKWDREAIPERLRDAIAHAAYSDFLRPAGKDAQVPIEDTLGGQFLLTEAMRLQASQRQAGRWTH